MKWVKRIAVAVIGILLALLYSYGTWEEPLYDTNIDAASYGNVGELEEGAVVEQTFLCRENGLKELDVTVSNLGYESDAKYSWSLKEKASGRVVAEGAFSGADVSNSEASVFAFDKQTDSRNKEYVFTVKTEKKGSGHGITLMKTDPSRSYKGSLAVNGTKDKDALVLKQQIQYLNVETCIVFLGLYAYLIGFMAFLTKLFK